MISVEKATTGLLPILLACYALFYLRENEVKVNSPSETVPVADRYDEIRAALLDTGYYSFKADEIWDPETMQILAKFRDNFKEFQKVTYDNDTKYDGYIDHNNGLTFGPVPRIFHYNITADFIMPIVNKISPELIMSSAALHTIFSGNHEGQRIHRDYPFSYAKRGDEKNFYVYEDVENQILDNTKINALVVVMAMTPVTEENGGTIFYPRSQFLSDSVDFNDLDHVSTLLEDEPIQFTGELGDMVFLNAALLHGAMPNFTKDRRVVYINHFVTEGHTTFDEEYEIFEKYINPFLNNTQGFEDIEKHFNVDLDYLIPFLVADSHVPLEAASI